MNNISKKELIKKSTTKLKEKAPDKPTARSIHEAEQIELDAKKSKLKNMELKNLELESLISMRKIYADKILWFGGAWSIITILLVLAKGFSLYGFDISSEVLITLIGSTVGNVFALAAVVAKGIFTNG